MSTQQNLTPELYEVERILQRGHSDGHRFYLVKWKGFTDDEATWEPENNLTGCQAAIEDFQRIMKLIESQHHEAEKLKNHSHKRKYKKKNTTVHMNLPEVKQQTQQVPKQEAVEPKRKNQSQRDRSKSQLSNNTSSDSKNRGRPKKKIKNSKDQFELQMDTSESDELQQTTAQTVPPSRMTEKFEIRDSKSKTKQIQPVIVESRLDKLTEGLKVDKSINFKVDSELKQHPTGEAGNKENTERKEQLDSSKRPSVSQNSVPSNKEEDVADNTTKKRLLSSSEDPIKILHNQKDSDARKSELKTKQEISDLVARVSNKDERTIVSVKREKSMIKTGLSQRQRLCQEEFEQLFLDEIGDYLRQCVKDKENGAMTEKLSQKLAKISRYSSQFVDFVSRPNFINSSAKFFSSVLIKKEVEKLDGNGEFLNSKIGYLIKTIDTTQETGQERWICLLMDREVSEGTSEYLVRVNDLEEGLWKKLFRRFTMRKDE